MGFEIFLSSYERGEPRAFPLADAEAVFDGAIVRRERDATRVVWHLAYPVLNAPEFPTFMEIGGQEYPVSVRDESTVYITVMEDTEGRPTIEDFMISGPAAHVDFYSALLQLLQTRHSALFWPGERSLVIGQLESIEHLPEGMVECLGEPFLVTTPQQIFERISAS